MVCVAVAVTLLPAGGALAASGVTRPTRSVASVVPSGELAGLRYYVVASGDTFASVARRFGVSPDTIRIANGITGPTLFVGARILLDAPNGPTSTPGMPRAAAATNAGTGVYTIRRGDSFARIAKRNHTTVANLLGINGMKASQLLLPGQAIRLTAAPALAPASSGSSLPPSPYTVKRGDSFARIAKRTGTTVAKILALNHLKVTHVLQPGQRLWVLGAAAPAARPAAPSSPTASSVRVVSCPVPGSTFSYDWGFPREGGRYHEGLDMFAPAGTPVLAPVDGRVTVGRSGISGSFWNLAGADGWSYFGAHLSKLAKTGKVRAGDVIGYVGNTGDAAGGPTHLHFQMRPSKGRPTDPFPYMSVSCHS
jgi:murein DD-endopeptidase MepM/ murein hydrolase activator NlpD